MAIFHMNVTPISRGIGRSATAASAYRSATKIHDERTGETHDYTAKRGVEHSEIVLPASLRDAPPDWASSREQLWNAAEKAERREDARVAREVEVALPAELSMEQRKILTTEFARQLAERYQCAVDVAIHKPHKEGDVRNHHAHLLLTTRVATADKLTDKTPIELSDTNRAKLGLTSGRKEITELRAAWSRMANEHLRAAGQGVSIDHRSLADQGIERTPTKHFGPVVAERLRRGKDSYVAERIRQERVVDANLRLAQAAERGRLEREGRGLARAILDTETTLTRALAARERARTTEPKKAPAHPITKDIDAHQTTAQTLWLEQRHAGRNHAPDHNPERKLILDNDHQR
jgi:ATP-dependent exoDNAse (exonuclease V) alpha subunit